MRQTIFGLIGTGGIAQSQHLPNLSRAPHAHLKTICDIREDVLRRMQDKYQVPHATGDYHELFADPEIEAVVVATREDQQAPLTIAALDAGKHVYVEKPLAETPEACAAVAMAQQRSGKFVAVGFNRRFAPAYGRARELLWADGGPKNIHYRVADDYWRWGRNYPPGVRVIHEVCHVFDILRWLAKSEVESIYCAASRADDEAFLLRFRSGCVATIMSSGYATTDLPKERLEAISDKGGVTVEDYAELRAYGYRAVAPVQRFAGHTHPDREFTPKYLLEAEGATALYALRRLGWELRERLESGETSGQPDAAEIERFIRSSGPIWNYMVDKGWLAAMDHFAQCVASGEAPQNATADDGLQASRLAEAAIRSRDHGELVRIPHLD